MGWGTKVGVVWGGVMFTNIFLPTVHLKEASTNNMGGSSRHPQQHGGQLMSPTTTREGGEAAHISNNNTGGSSHPLYNKILHSQSLLVLLAKKPTWIRASSPNLEQARVGVVPRNPESVTSSTVSPIERTSVAFVNETTMKASYSSEEGTRNTSVSYI